MPGFLLGVIVSLLVIFGGAYYYATRGYFDTRAIGNTPSSFERTSANKSLAKWVAAHAPQNGNPFSATMDNIMDGSMTYEKNCAPCHGSLKQPLSPMRTNFYPPVPQFMSRPIHGPDNNLFYIIKYGIRYTAMPGWDGLLSDEDIWKTVLFLKNSEQMKTDAQPQSGNAKAATPPSE